MTATATETAVKPIEPHLEQLINLRYPAGEWAVVFELQKGVGFQGTTGRIDAAAFGCWPSKGHPRLAFEVKRSRGDFLRERRQPEKRRWVEDNFHQTWFVVPSGLVKPDEVPESWGLLAATKDGKKLRQVKVAMHREVAPLPESMALSAIRSIAGTLASLEGRQVTFDGETITQADLDKRAQLRAAGNVALQRELERDRRVLLEPLAVLGTAVLGWDAGRHVNPRGSDPSDVTADMVREWIGHLSANQDRETLTKLKAARDAMNELLGEKA